MKFYARVLSGITGALAASLVALAAHAQAPADWDKTVAAAKAEGKVVFYSGLVGSPSTAARSGPPRLSGMARSVCGLGAATASATHAPTSFNPLF